MDCFIAKPVLELLYFIALSEPVFRATLWNFIALSEFVLELLYGLLFSSVVGR